MNEIIEWINSFSELPHCFQDYDINKLKDGIALAEITSTILKDSKLKSYLLSQITISNVNQGLAQSNMVIFFETLRILGMSNLYKYQPE